ncbi:MAG: hypothetical protein JSV82_08510 [Planctomycetota bacterium]|nr:MAG: hypothetical protein JSV82_08510 [Planctomycetota bacterium]
MGRLRILVVCSIIILPLGGCRGYGREESGVEVIIEDDGRFPEFLTGGIWKQDKQYNWMFKFKPDGTLSKLRHTLNVYIAVDEGGTFIEGDDDYYAFFVLGPCDVEYNPSTRELNVTVILEHFTMKLPIGTIEGSSRDYFSGIVSEDGMTWEADWLSYNETVGADTQDPNLVPSIPLVFTKIDINNINEIE